MDYEATCDEKIPLWKSWAASGKVQEAIDQLLALEKQTRTVSCFFSCLHLGCNALKAMVGCMVAFKMENMIPL